jgi:hypothetical protein
LELDSIEFKSLSNKAKIERLEELAKSLSADVSGSKTVFYSGTIEGQSARDIAEAIADKDPNARIINKTAVGDFLGNAKFEKALAEAMDIDFNLLKKGDVPSSLLNEYNSKLYNTDPANGKLGFWSEASKRFAMTAKGDIIALIGDDANKARVFNTVEFPELIKNHHITSINNTPISEFKKAVDVIPDNIIHLISLESSKIIASSKNDYGKILNLTDTDITNSFKEPEVINKFNELSKNARQALGSSDNVLKFCKGLNKLGPAFAIISFLAVSSEAAQMYTRGDIKGGDRLMELWAVDEAGSLIGGAAGSTIASIALVAAAAAGSVISAPIAAAVILGAGAAGAFLGSDFVFKAYENSDSDNNGQIDIIDKFKNTIFGAGTNLPAAIPSEVMQGGQIVFKPYNNLSISEIVLNAKTDPAWGYALKHLNPFVIEGIDYSRHNKNGELDMNTYSDTYLETRAKMLLWRLEFTKTGTDFARDYNTDKIKGNWDFIDYSNKLAGGEPLQLAIDGKDITLSDHKIIFASGKIEGGGSGDLLFGGKEADTIEAKDGNDYIEGGRGDDILRGGKGDDTYYFGVNHGSDTIEDIGGKDTILFGKGINKDDITVSIDGDNLFVSVNNKGTMIKIENWNKDKNAIEYIKFEDDKSTVLQKEDILLLIEKEKSIGDKKIIDKLENQENSNIPDDINNNKEVKKANLTDNSNSSISTNIDESNLINTNGLNTANTAKPKFSLADMMEKFCNEKAALNKDTGIVKEKSPER